MFWNRNKKKVTLDQILEKQEFTYSALKLTQRQIGYIRVVDVTQLNIKLDALQQQVNAISKVLKIGVPTKLNVAILKENK